jgi:hypothetical protein
MVEKDKAMHQLEYVSSPMTGFRGWSLAAGITLPFSFWTLGKNERTSR